MENESPIYSVAKEAVSYTIAELHVHGILAGITVVTSHYLTEDIAAMTLTGVGIGIFIFVHYKHNKIKLKVNTAKSGKPKMVWVTKNF